MNNTDNTPEPRYPFVPMFANGLPQADFYVNGVTAPVLISPRSASGDTRHEWTGYLKIMNMQLKHWNSILKLFSANMA